MGTRQVQVDMTSVTQDNRRLAIVRNQPRLEVHTLRSKQLPKRTLKKVAHRENVDVVDDVSPHLHTYTHIIQRTRTHPRAPYCDTRPGYQIRTSTNRDSFPSMTPTTVCTFLHCYQEYV